jgi:hypothetical protein
MPDTKTVIDTLLSKVTTQTQDMMRSMSLGCSGGSGGVPPVNWDELANYGNSAVKTLGDLRVALAADPQTPNAVQQINTVEAQLGTIINRVHDNCSGDAHGRDPVYFSSYQQTVAVATSELETVKLLLGV